MFVWSWLLIFSATLTGVELFRRWSVRRSLLDVPNERSSHSTPTPRGGGAIIVGAIVIGCGIYSVTSGDYGFAPYVGAAVIVAVVSFIDDVRPLSPFVRLFAHSVAAAIAVYFSGGVRILELPIAGATELGWLAIPVGFMFIIWLTNAYNFMDGIDGIAASQAIIAGIAWAATGFLCGAPEIAFIGGTAAAASAGFLVFNWQPARIFMGDVGSAFLGFLFAIVPLYAAQKVAPASGRIGVAGFIFVWLFVFDTVLTFCRRAARGDKLWQAHREHIYQRLVIGGLPHAVVTTIYGVLAAVSAFGAVVFLFGRPMNIGWTVGLTAAVTMVLLVFYIGRRRGFIEHDEQK